MPPPPVLSAGLLLHRPGPGGREVLIAHMGGPLWARRDERAWSIPKGLVEAGERAEDAAAREFVEELGLPVPPGSWTSLGEVAQRGKRVVAWALEADLDPAAVVPGTFTTTWPPRSGRTATFPEVDRVAWSAPADARRRLVAAQAAFVDRLLDGLGDGRRPAGAGAD